MLRFLIYFTAALMFSKWATSAYELNPPPFPCSEYEMLIVNTHQCVARCPVVCVMNICFENAVCPCDGHYETSFTKGLVCAANCLPGCVEAGGFCASPNHCVCRKGYAFDALARRCRKQHRLLDLCRGYGTCSFNGECICAEGYQLSATLLLGQVCTPICNNVCGPHAYCHMPNMCACRNRHYHFGPDGRCHKDY